MKVDMALNKESKPSKNRSLILNKYLHYKHKYSCKTNIMDDRLHLGHTHTHTHTHTRY